MLVKYDIIMHLQYPLPNTFIFYWGVLSEFMSILKMFYHVNTKKNQEILQGWSEGLVSVN